MFTGRRDQKDQGRGREAGAADAAGQGKRESSLSGLNIRSSISKLFGYDNSGDQNNDEFQDAKPVATGGAVGIVNQKRQGGSYQTPTRQRYGQGLRGSGSQGNIKAFNDGQ